MDDDLKILISVEADEEESANRISAQLPSIAAKVNGKGGPIKLQVEADTRSVQAQVQRISQQLSKAASHTVGLNVGIDRAAIQRVQEELNKIGVGDSITKSITAEMDRMGVRIDQISGAWKDAADGEQRLLNLTIQGTDQLGRNLTIAKQYTQSLDESTGELQEQSSTITRIVSNLEKQRQTEAKIAAQAKSDNESRIAYLSRQQSILNSIQSSYTGASSSKPIEDEGRLASLNGMYEQIQSAINELGASSGRVSAEQRADIERQIASLKLLVEQYQNVEYVATKLRTKTVQQVNTEQGTGLAEYEERLRSGGILTEQFEQRIRELRTQLDSAFDNKSLTAYLNSFDQLQRDVAAFQEKVRSVNNLYAELSKVEKAITRIQVAMTKVDQSPESGQYASMQKELAIQQRIKSEIQGQIDSYKEINAYASQAVAYKNTQVACEERLKTAQAAVADQASAITGQMAAMDATVRNVEARFRGLDAPTEELRKKVSELPGLLNRVNTAAGDQDKVAAFTRLQEVLSGCNREITSLMALQRLDLQDDRFTANLEKAKADLETIRRQWSALFSSKDLRNQFNALSASIDQIRTKGDLTRWTSQFNVLKSEIKAAGLNAQTFFDTLKTNIGKVGQWLGATTVFFQMFNTLQRGVETVIALDTAMIDLQKVTDNTEKEYRQFYFTANETAKALGATTEEIIAQTAEWARLGYTMEEAAKLAENSAIFSAISEDLDLEAATDGLVSILKAYEDTIDINDALDGVISKVNEVGNRYAVNNSDVVEALRRSSASMAVANNTFEETVALATAAIEITRDASSVGNALKTISMRIRGYDEETEEYVGGVTELTGAIADLTKTAERPQGISLFEEGDPDTFRSTYDILNDIADIWDDLTDKNRADLLETLFGKHRAQVGAAMLSNFEQARNAIVTMEESAGSAEAEMENIYDSLEYKLNELGQTWVGVAQNLFNTDGLKMIVDVLTALSSAVDVVTEKFGFLGTVGLAATLVNLGKLVKTAGRPKLTGSQTVPAYTLVVTRNELAA